MHVTYTLMLKLDLNGRIEVNSLGIEGKWIDPMLDCHPLFIMEIG